MKDKFLCVIAKYDEETQLKLTELQNILLEKGFIGKQTTNIPYHITLGLFPLEKEDFIKERIIEVSKSISSFNINLNNIGLFGLDVLFISPSVNHQLLELQSNFKSDYDSFDWVAHTTVLIDEKEEILRALPYVAENFKSFSTKIESIVLYECFPARFILEEKLL